MAARRAALDVDVEPIDERMTMSPQQQPRLPAVVWTEVVITQLSLPAHELESTDSRESNKSRQYEPETSAHQRTHRGS